MKQLSARGTMAASCMSFFALGSITGALGLGTVLLALSLGNAVLTVVAVILIGFCFGPIFPTALSIMTSTFWRAPGSAASVVVAMGSLGGMLLPWVQGALLSSSAPISSVLLVAASTLAMLALGFGRGLINGRRPAASNPRVDCEAKCIDA